MMEPQPGIDGLLVAAKQGEKAAENQLFSLLRARILALVQQRIWNTRRHPSEIRKDAEDLTEDICAVIFRRCQTGSFNSGFMPWVMQIARNRIGQYYGERDRRQDKYNPLPDENALTDNAIDLEAELEGKELDNIIFSALKKMGQPCAEIIKALMEGEIKDYLTKRRLTTSIDTIYGQIFRCREKLKVLLHKQGYKI
jgi:RNA polymerase sigma factor (sigma-70 family)